MKYVIVVILVFFFVSCSIDNKNRDLISLNEIEIKEVSFDTSVISELFLPSDIYSVGKDVVLVNSNKSKNVLYRYDASMKFIGSCFFYGNGRNEFNYVSGCVKDGNDSTLYLYTDYFYCSEFLFTEDSLRIVNEYKILDELQNNVIVLNDSLVFYRMLQSDHPFGIYNRNVGKLQKEFGKFPKSPIKSKTKADLDNVCLSNSVYDRQNNRLFSFYESLPVVRIYDIDTYRLVKEIIISDIKEQIMSLDDYYDDKGIVYFLRPVFSGGKIYVTLIDASPENGVPENMELLAFDMNGNIVSRYKFGMYCPIYTVSESGVFYGVSMLGEEYILCKAYL